MNSWKEQKNVTRMTRLFSPSVIVEAIHTGLVESRTKTSISQYLAFAVSQLPSRKIPVQLIQAFQSFLQNACMVAWYSSVL